jgi:hypothetical protein
LVVEMVTEFPLAGSAPELQLAGLDQSPSVFGFQVTVVTISHPLGRLYLSASM